eukprot:TRINITY_DN221_c3_g1_i1.p1 TRINITY_DN221_c3_g1~~TRINITY_DN221_c3_g1_i1.p1  ORF type:complete len:724 (+),score=226.17 TRINITY_DN221_c3_g1_i1:64-2235(+)
MSARGFSEDFVCTVCKEKTSHYARNMCRRCYKRLKRRENPTTGTHVYVRKTQRAAWLRDFGPIHQFSSVKGFLNSFIEHSLTDHSYLMEFVAFCQKNADFMAIIRDVEFEPIKVSLPRQKHEILTKFFDRLKQDKQNKLRTQSFFLSMVTEFAQQKHNMSIAGLSGEPSVVSTSGTPNPNSTNNINSPSNLFVPQNNNGTRAAGMLSMDNQFFNIQGPPQPASVSSMFSSTNSIVNNDLTITLPSSTSLPGHGNISAANSHTMNSNSTNNNNVPVSVPMMPLPTFLSSTPEPATTSPSLMYNQQNISRPHTPPPLSSVTSFGNLNTSINSISNNNNSNNNNTQQNIRRTPTPITFSGASASSVSRNVNMQNTNGCNGNNNISGNGNNNVVKQSNNNKQQHQQHHHQQLQQQQQQLLKRESSSSNINGNSNNNNSNNNNNNGNNKTNSYNAYPMMTAGMSAFASAPHNNMSAVVPPQPLDEFVNQLRANIPTDRLLAQRQQNILFGAQELRRRGVMELEEFTGLVTGSGLDLLGTCNVKEAGQMALQTFGSSLIVQQLSNSNIVVMPAPRNSTDPCAALQSFVLSLESNPAFGLLLKGSGTVTTAASALPRVLLQQRLSDLDNTNIQSNQPPFKKSRMDMFVHPLACMAMPQFGNNDSSNTIANDVQATADSTAPITVGDSLPPPKTSFSIDLDSPFAVNTSDSMFAFDGSLSTNDDTIDPFAI